MNFPVRIALTAALTGGFFMSAQSIVAAKSPSVTSGQAPLLLVKKGAMRIDIKDGFPWSLPEGRTSNVEILMKDAVVELQWIDVEKDGDDALTLTLSPYIEISQDREGKPLDMETTITAQELVLEFARSKGDFPAAMKVTSPAFALMSNSVGAETGQKKRFSMISEGLTVSGDSDAFESFADDLDALSGISSGSVKEFDDTQVSLEYAADSLAVSIDDGPEQVVGSFAQTAMQLVKNDERFAVSVSANDASVTQMKPRPDSVSVGSMDLSLTMPSAESDDPQNMAVSINASDVSAPRQLWAQFDPNGAFVQEISRVVVELDLEGVFVASPFDKEKLDQIKASGAERMIPTRMTIETLEFDGLGLKVSGRGNVDLDGKKPTDLSAFLSVKGLSEFMIATQKAGLLKQPQAIMGEGLANQLGKEEADGSLTFDVGIKGKMIVINGAPIVPLPAAK